MCKRQKCGTRLKLFIKILSVSCAVFVILSMLGTFIVFDALFGRHDTADSEQIPADCVTVEISENNFDLCGYLYENEDAPGLIIYCHGFNSCAMSHQTELEYYHDHGWTVLAFDSAGTCRSGGSGVMGLQQMLSDIDSVLDWVSTQPMLADLPVILCGHSNGGYAAAAFAGDERITAIVSIAAFDSALELMEAYARRKAGPIAYSEEPFLRAYLYLKFGKYAFVSASEALDNSDCSVLLLYGTDDRIIYDELSLYYRMNDSNRPNLTCVLMDGRGHNDIWQDENGILDTVTMEMIDTFMHGSVA